MTEKLTAPTTDFSQFLLSPTGRVEINLPNGEPMLCNGQRVAINVYAPASAEYARASAAVQRAARDKLLKGKKASDEADESAEIDAKFLTAITRDIEHFPYPGGAPAIYRERGLMYIGEQVRAYLNDEGNFFGR